MEIDRKVATALLYGVRSDTRDLGRGVSPKDVDACMYFYQRVLWRLLSQIERCPEMEIERLGIDAFVADGAIKPTLVELAKVL